MFFSFFCRFQFLLLWIFLPHFTHQLKRGNSSLKTIDVRFLLEAFLIDCSFFSMLVKSGSRGFAIAMGGTTLVDLWNL
uniref:Putative secreted protein n=1 Tax=Anopheles darlingi TaxID=43151 RepID=A0A2M4D7L5_ANODA